MPNRTSRPTSARPADPAPAQRPHHPLRGGPAPILTACLLWGTTGTVSSFAPAGAPAAAIGCAGLALGGILLLLTSRGARSLPARCTRSERRLLLLGAFAVAGYPVTFYPAVARTGVAVATVIALGSAPVFAGLLAWLTGRARRPPAGPAPRRPPSSAARSSCWAPGSPEPAHRSTSRASCSPPSPDCRTPSTR
ncbi:EamA family transporter [Streptomyces phaeoluteigriseus]|uniref:EamA family transporter n=1 Tax=Streptomyces phaeoluteigriseus TaxID=114686 RepID=UPI001FEB80FD|nr:EamA family transporter [Streptomyces phaeoluteigriseus]